MMDEPKETKVEPKIENVEHVELNFQFLFVDMHKKIKESYLKHESLLHNRSYDSGVLLGMFMKEIEIVSNVMESALNGDIRLRVINNPNNPNNASSLNNIKGNEDKTELYI